MSGLERMAPPLVGDWDRIAAQIQSSRRVVVFLDFDGTLVNIAPRPDQVRLAPLTRRVLRRLSRHPRVTVVVISGRRRAELLRYVGLRGIRYFGLYGWERGRRSPLPASALIALRRVCTELSIHLSVFRGVWVEDKHFSLSVHFLGVPPRVEHRARRKLRSLLLPFQKTLHVIENVRDAEIVPRHISGKGTAVRELLAKPTLSHALALYFGDDLSDEPAFEALRKGISIRVGAARPTCARYSVPSPATLASVLARLEATLR
jgi:trehalose 6-phosphate phosphatase